MQYAKTAFRSVVLFAFLGLLLLPDGASAIGRRRPMYASTPQPVCQPMSVLPACPPPVYYYCPTPQLAPPTVKPEPSKPAPPKAAVEPPATIRPAAAATPVLAVPPMIEKIESPPTIPPTNLKFDPFPIVPAIPSPAVPLGIPPATPVVPEFKPAESPKVPQLVPPLSIPDLSSSTSRSSPLLNRPKSAIDIYPVDGAAPASPEAIRNVVFFNRTDRDVKLALGGKAITLPKMHSVSAEVSAEFSWKLDDESERTTRIPATVPGVDIVIRK